MITMVKSMFRKIHAPLVLLSVLSSVNAVNAIADEVMLGKLTLSDVVRSYNSDNNGSISLDNINGFAKESNGVAADATKETGAGKPQEDKLNLYSRGAMQVSEVLAADAIPVTLDTVIVTGTRDTGKKARDSATPIDIVSGDDLVATGQTNLLDALKNILPSVNAQAVGYDFGALARTFQLRGLSPS